MSRRRLPAIVPLASLIGFASVAFGGCGSSATPTDARMLDGARDTLAPEAATDADALPATDGGLDALPATDGGLDATPAPDGADYGDDGGACLPGVPRCHGDFGYETCEQDGTWSESHSCAGYSSNGTTSYCAEIPMDGGGSWATCVDPACWYWLGRGALGVPSLPVGICEPDGSFEACSPGGTLAPVTCAGVCTSVAALDGRALGYCAPACEDGARECLGGAFYRTCVQGRWSATIATCEGACNPLAEGPRPDIRCGGACEPGTSRCRADAGGIETCEPGGTWKAERTCVLGRCRPAGPQAECETECAPGEHQCAFDGADAERVCGATGLWQTETACAGGTACRLSGDVALGCVACAGSGNAYGAADSRCGPAGVEVCGADDLWGTDAPCSAGDVCASLTRGPSTLAACQRP